MVITDKRKVITTDKYDKQDIELKRNQIWREKLSQLTRKVIKIVTKNITPDKLDNEEEMLLNGRQNGGEYPKVGRRPPILSFQLWNYFVNTHCFLTIFFVDCWHSLNILLFENVFEWLLICLWLISKREKFNDEKVFDFYTSNLPGKLWESFLLYLRSEPPTISCIGQVQVSTPGFH